MNPFTDDELLNLLNDLESDRSERKRSLKGDTPDKARQAICAFANDVANHNKAGVLFIGVTDDGMPSGEPITDKLLIDLANMKTDGNILPLPVMLVEKRILKQAEIAVVTVTPSDMPPVKYDGRIWIRVGPRRAVASEQEERILIERRRYKNLPYDLYPIPAAVVHNLSRAVFEDDYLPAAFAPDILDANNRTYEERLASCKMIASLDDASPTILGLLSIGKNPQNFIPGACVQFLRIDGIDITDNIIDEEQISGAISDMLRRVTEKLKAHNRRAVNVTSGDTHKITTPYPLAAILQIVYNAVLHRTYENTNAPVRIYWYNDRIEIISPGGPYGNVTPGNFGDPGITDYRNPNLAAVMKTFGFVQAFGRGIAIARSEMLKNGNPALEFITDNSMVRCVLKKS
jgi:ATP-dependent DNA helicase RecG